jgi:hypothetical protein
MVTSFGTLEPAAAPLVAEGAAMTVHGSVVMGKALLEFSKHKEGKYEGEKKHGSQKLKNVAQHNKLSAGDIINCLQARLKSSKMLVMTFTYWKGVRMHLKFDLHKNFQGEVKKREK